MFYSSNKAVKEIKSNQAIHYRKISTINFSTKEVSPEYIRNPSKHKIRHQLTKLKMLICFTKEDMQMENKHV